jgi:hypothetical protein
MKYSINQYPKNKPIDYSKLNEYQIIIRNNQKKYVYGQEKTCNTCFVTQSIDEFYVKDKETGRRANKCRDCRLKEEGVVEIGKLRFSEKLLNKGFRRCSVCKEIKPLNKFTKLKNHYGGHSNNCYECQKKLTHEFVKNQRENIGDFYVRQYGLKKGITVFDEATMNLLREEIIESRKPIFFIDNKEFVTKIDFAKYIREVYGVPVTATLMRIYKGYSEENCKLSGSEARSLAYTKGAIQVTDTITKNVFHFKNTRDEKLRLMFSDSAITRAIKTKEKTRVTSISKYKNPCLIERITNY